MANKSTTKTSINFNKLETEVIKANALLDEGYEPNTYEIAATLKPEIFEGTKLQKTNLSKIMQIIVKYNLNIINVNYDQTDPNYIWLIVKPKSKKGLN